MNIKVNFDNIEVKEDKNNYSVKVLMLKGEKGDPGEGEDNIIEKVQVNGSDLPVTNKTVNVLVPTVDTTLSSSSTNPVQNKVIYTALGNKVNNSDLNNYYEISEIDGLIDDIDDLLDKKPYYFDSVASMKAYDLKAGDYVVTKGYYNPEDGGNGEYIIIDDDSLADDGGLIHVLTNGLRAKLIIEEIVNIKQMGAKSDGTTDCSGSFSTAISKCNTIYVPEGNYLVSGNINLLTKDLEIYGTSNTFINNNENHIFIKTTNEGYINIHDLNFNVNNNYCAIKYDSEVNIQTHNNSIRINNCKFFGISRETETTAIYLDGVYNPIITECFFNRLNAIYQELSINALISGCTFRECNYGVNFNGVGATAKSCGDKIIGCDFTECNVGVKAITTDWININDCIIDYCLYPIILLGQENGNISNVYMSAKNGNPVIYINKDLSNVNDYLNGNNTTSSSKSITVSNCFISNNLEIDYDTTAPNLSSDNLVVTCSWFTMNDCTVDNYSRNGINLIDSNNITIKHCRFTKTAKYTPVNDVYSIYGTTNNSNTNYDVANFKFIGIITNDTISRYQADISQTVTSVLIYEKHGMAAIPAGQTNVTINTGLHIPMRTIQLTTSANTKVFYDQVQSDGSSFRARISDTFEYPVQVSWHVKG